MAIQDSPESVSTATSTSRNESNLSSVRRRPIANTEKAASDSPPKTASSEAENAVIDSEDDRNRIGDGGVRVESSNGLSNATDGGGEKAGNGEARAGTCSGAVTGDKIGIGAARERESFTKFVYRPSAPAHRSIKESPLSSDAIFNQSHAGLFNLCIVVLVAVNSRLIIENLMKYGLLISSNFWFSSRSLRDWPLLMCCLSLNILPLAAFVAEKLVRQKHISESAVVTVHIVITTLSVLYPVLVIVSCDSAVQSGVTLMLFACIVWLKLVSYAHTNYDMRALQKSLDKGEVLPDSLGMDYSDTLSFKSLAYFMVAPTLCYQPSYPHTACVRKGWVSRQFIKLVIFTGVMGFIIEQYINPIVRNSQHPLKANLLYAIERVLKLSVPNLYVWLCMFYCFFHLWLNILAELLCFGDREFYKDWWNAQTVEEYWRMWNMPVHKWMIRHIYFPCLRNGIPKVVAVLIAFLVSAIFHELCIAVPCHIFKFWAFFGIMFQVPLVMLTKFLHEKFRNYMVGNMLFWCFFSILGQPMCVLLYYHDVMNRKVTI